MLGMNHSVCTHIVGRARCAVVSFVQCRALHILSLGNVCLPDDSYYGRGLGEKFRRARGVRPSVRAQQKHACPPSLISRRRIVCAPPRDFSTDACVVREAEAGGRKSSSGNLKRFSRE